jgi:putative FmdB family regulatory protein
MPIYHYKTAKDGCEYCRGGFDVMQSMKDKPLRKCPQCQGPVKKVPASVSGYTPMLSNSNLRDKGFTKFQKRGDGTYEKTT